MGGIFFLQTHTGHLKNYWPSTRIVCTQWIEQALFPRTRLREALLRQGSLLAQTVADMIFDHPELGLLNGMNFSSPTMTMAISQCEFQKFLKR